MCITAKEPNMYDLMRKLPIGIQTFEDIRRKNYLYVDKTALVWRMANMGKPYFLSRPRRFGKSLLLSTFESYFLGKKELFEGLAIEKMETEWKEYPVLHIDLNAEKYDKPEKLNEILSNHLTQWELKYGKGIDERTLSSRFGGVIRRACEQTGQQVVVLVDEYDKPLLQAINNLELLDDYRQTLKAFYGVLKSADRYLRFVFLTGVTKFSQVSVFSDLNQLNDISMKPPYATVCGITRQELVDTFTPELKNLSEANQLTFEETLQKMAAINENKYDFIVVNFANGDMVGHTGIYEAIEKAVVAVDACVKDVIEAAKAQDYEAIIIADHGNADHALNEDGTPNTAHSLNPVPCVYVTENKAAKVGDGRLADVAPTILKIMGLAAPAEMDGNVLIK